MKQSQVSTINYRGHCAWHGLNQKNADFSVFPLILGHDQFVSQMSGIVINGAY